MLQLKRMLYPFFSLQINLVQSFKTNKTTKINYKLPRIFDFTKQ
jgi:hypothetical protein